MKAGDNYNGLQLLTYCGGGAYGDVFYCEDLSHKKMAVKIISKQKLGEHWKRELKGVSNYRKLTFDDPNLLKIFQVSEDKDYFYYTMEAADSLSKTEYKADTLAARMEYGMISESDVFFIIRCIFNGIKAIHAAGFSHRDIKPDNILFVNGVPKLADLGLLSSFNTAVTTLVGTFEFIPPEIRSSSQNEYYDNYSRQRCDLYAFGKVIYSIVSNLDAQFFPSIPEKKVLSLPLKLFICLSLELCYENPQKRLTSIAALEKKLSIIERQLLYGETLKSKIYYAIWKSKTCDISEINELSKMGIKKFTFILAFILTVLCIYIPIDNDAYLLGTSPGKLYIIESFPIGFITIFLILWLVAYCIADIIKKVIHLHRRPKF